MAHIDQNPTASGAAPLGVAPAVPVRTQRGPVVSRSVALLLLLAGMAGIGVGLSGASFSPEGLGALLTVLGIGAFVAGAARLVRCFRPRADGFLWLSSAWLVLLVALSAAAGLLPLAESLDPSMTLFAPALESPAIFSTHPLGTDTTALDVLGQIIYGARVSIIVALGAAAIAMIVGGLIGTIAGYARGAVDTVASFFADAMLSFPPLILLLALAALLDPNLFNITVALGFIVAPSFFRLARANTIKVANREYVVAARIVGAKRGRILVREIVPNVIPSLVAYSFIVMGLLVVVEASLSYLGLGIQRPTPTWGNLISQGEQYLTTSPHLVLAPAFFLFATVLTANYIGQHLQKKWGL